MFTLASRWRRYWQQWLQLKIKRTPHKQLNRRNIYIVPTKAGLGLVFTTLLILFAAINYENNSLFLLGFSALAIFWLSIFSTFENLQGLSLRAVPPTLVQCKEQACLSVMLNQTKARSSYALRLSLAGVSLDVEQVAQEPVRASVWALAARRGRMVGGYLKIETRYPLGLVKAWSYADLGVEAYVYPRPQQGDLISAGSAAAAQTKRLEADDYRNIRRWQQGESPRRIIWPAYARANELVAFEYDHLSPHPRLLDWDYVAGDTETKLSILCYWVLYCGQQNEPFALRLPQQQLPLAVGAPAVAAALTALALMGQHDV